MSRRTNSTNRSGAAIGVNRYTGKLMPRKKKNLPAATGQAQAFRKISTLIVRDFEEEIKMVKVTIEYDGKVYQREGDLFIGQISTFKGCKATASAMVVGTGAPQRVTKSLERMTINIIKKLSKDPVIVCGSLIEIQEGIDRAIREYMKENVDGMLGNLRQAMAGEEGGR